MSTDDLSKCRKLSGEEAELHISFHVLRPLHKLETKKRKGFRDHIEAHSAERQFIRDVLDEFEQSNLAVVIGPPARAHST